MKDLRFRDRMMGAGFAPQPRVILRSPKVSMQAKQLYNQLMDYAWHGEAFPGRNRLAAENGVHVNSIDNYLRELKNFGLITIERRGKKLTNLYIIETITEELIEKLCPVLEWPIPTEEDDPEEKPKRRRRKADEPGEEKKPAGRQKKEPDAAEEKTKSKTSRKPKKEEDEPDEQFYERVIKYFNHKVGTNYRSTTKEIRRQIKKIWQEGYRGPEFKKVIDTKVEEWINDDEMSKYLRPKTLFAKENFINYLNQIKPKRTNTSSGAKPSAPDPFLLKYYGNKGL
jgi:uncharacterized phage protein (TIGR02220 family)